MAAPPVSGWHDAAPAERMLAVLLARGPWWLRTALWVTVRLPGPLGRAYDRLERYGYERELLALRRRRAVRR